jgi:hypothetical protein
MQDISKYSTFAMLPSDLSQQIFNELVDSKCLTEALLENFRDCALHVRFLLPIFFRENAKSIAFGCIDRKEGSFCLYL